MKIFLDSIDIERISFFSSYGMIDGITTNPTLFSQISGDFKKHIKEICDVVPDKPVSVEIISNDYSEMEYEAFKIAEISPNIVIKIPISWAGIKLCKFLYSKNIPTNMTLCFSANQALLVAKAKATYISPFVGRLDDISISGIKLIEDIKKIFDNYNIDTQILAASVRNIDKINALALIGPDIITISPNLLKEMLYHNLTEIGLEKFLSDWKNSELKI